MKPADTKRLYESACKTRRVTPQEDEARAWHKNLLSFEVRDVQAALDAWWASTARDEKGELRSRWLPAPAELKEFTERAVRRLAVDAAEPQDMVMWECVGEGRHRYTGFYPRSKPTPAKKHCGCGAELRALERRAA